MRAILFRRVVVDGVNYYQLFKDDYNFDYDPIFEEYANRREGDFFYVDVDSDIEIPEPVLLNIYTDDGDKLILLNDSKLYERVFTAFKNKYHFFVRKLKPVRDIVNKVKKKILFQDSCVRDLVNQIYLNQSIVSSNLPIELKVSQKNNILFHGISGSGKKTIIESLKDEINIPYVEILISADIKDTLETIITKLLERSENEEEASHGIVFIRDNFSELSSIMGSNVYSVIDYITSQGIINYHGTLIDFRTITFVVLFDDDRNVFTNEEEIETIQNILDNMIGIKTKELTNKEKYMVLFSRNGRLRHYEKFLNQHGKRLIVDDDILIKIINECSKINPSMSLLNGVIDKVVKISMMDGISDVKIDTDCAKMLLPILSSHRKDNGKKNSSRKVDKYSFEKKIDSIVSKVKEDVIGQDETVKMLVYQLASNLLWANKDGVDDPKNYIKNILIRGNTGTGKTFIVGKVLKYLGAPYYIADATEYTEAGYVGKDVEDMLVDLYHAAGDDLEKAERGILVIDEIDKKASHGSERGRDVSGGSVQEALYKFAEGTVIKINIGNRINEIPIYFDTSRLTIICSGAFEGIEDIRDERIGKKKAGFGSQETNGKDLSITDEDYINYGMKSQFMRRVKHILELKNVSKEQFIDIMKSSNSSSLKVEQNTLKDLGIELEYTEEFYSILADKALSMKQGVTGIEKALVKVLQSVNIQDIRASEIKKIILNGEVVDNPNAVILIPRENQKVKRK